jgi:branched-chain amino acid transport system permease protein
MKSREFAAVIAFVIIATVIHILITMHLINPYWELIIQYACLITIAALGLNIIYGLNGQFSLGHIAFYGVGAYSAAMVTKGLQWDNPAGFVVAILLGGAVAATVAFLIGLPILRLRSDYLGIATLGFGIIVKVAFDNSDALSPMFGGSRGMTGIPKRTRPLGIHRSAGQGLARAVVQSPPVVLDGSQRAGSIRGLWQGGRIGPLGVRL